MSNAGYQHSEVFASLKKTKEVIQGSLTTYQWLQTLDFFIESAIDPIVTANPDLVDNYFAKVIAWQAHKPSTKFSRSDKFKLPILLFNSLTTSNEVKRKHQKTMLLNRGILFGLLAVFNKTLNNYRKLHDPRLKISKVDRQLLLNIAESRTSPYLYAAMIQSDYWSTKAYRFKELIIQKYTRFALNHAQSAYKKIGYVLRLDDVVQTYLIFLSKAIDRCDSRQGVLTTFIQTWFYSARAEIMKIAEDGWHASYEDLLENGLDLLPVLPDNSYEEMQHLSYIAKDVDKKGCLRFSLGIPEFFDKKQLAQLQLFTT